MDLDQLASHRDVAFGESALFLFDFGRRSDELAFSFEEQRTVAKGTPTTSRWFGHGAPPA
jgi:hypothetical protein